MIINYYLVQYVADPLRGETRNIGVIGRSGWQTAYRTIGTMPEGVNLGYYAPLCAGSGLDIWSFAEWEDWFRELVSEWLDPERFDYVMEGLDVSGRITTRKGGVLEVSGEKPLREAIDHLFYKLVTVPSLPKRHKFQERLEQVMRESEVAFRPDLQRDVEVEFEPPGVALETVRLWGLLGNKPRIVFKVIRFRTARDSVIRQVNDTLYTLQKVVEHGFAAKDRCVILTETVPDVCAGYAQKLEESGHLINIHDQKAPGLVRSITQRP